MATEQPEIQTLLLTVFTPWHNKIEQVEYFMDAD